MLKKTLMTLFLLSFAVISIAQEIKVSDIQIEGNSRIEKSAIMAMIPIKPGDQTSLENIDKVMHDIFSLGRFADVSAELTEVQGAKILTFVVKELPLIRRIEFIGNDKLSKEKLRPLVKIRTPSLYNRAKINESIVEIKNAYIEDGYHAAKIVSELQTDIKNEATLTFKVTEGKKVLIRDIQFVGNTIFDKGDLLKKIETKERWFLSWITDRGTYLEETLELDIERIKAAYHDEGYQDVKVKPAQVTLVEDEALDVLIEIDEGAQYKVGKVSVSGDLMASEEQLLKMVKLKPGDVFSRTVLRDSIDALTDLYADSGYAYANVTPLTNKDKKNLLIDLNMEVEQGIQVYVERIEISGNTKTRDKIIRREIPLAEGSLYSAKRIKDANRRIRNLGFFDEVNVTNKPGSDEDQTVLGVDVAEKPTGTFSIGVGYSSTDKLMAQGSLSQDNFMGYGVRLSLSGSLGSSSNTYSLGISDPHFLDTDWTLGGEIYKSEREYDDYDDHRTGFSIRTGHPVSLNSKLYLTYRYEEQEILNIDYDTVGYDDPWIYERESTLSSITTEWIRNSTDYYQDPSRGGITNISLEYAGLGGTEDFVKTIVEHRHFFPLFWGTVFSIHGEVGYVVSTNGDDVSITEKFFLGGIRTMRGFETREVGPVDEDGDYIGGEKMGYFNFEYLFPIYKDLGLKGVLFYDTGNAWSDDEEYFSDMRNSVGAGIRWQSPLGPLRFEWGYNLSPRDSEKQSVFEFSIGKSF
ncbi:Beta-barrel assembly machine subunit BamA [Desulfuromusa kysingii]|uniref:Outer membrane protein assembly factor BamA n=1 Tax=Desulfuromusa kysingii TaxID=37625 RepID=A0A1H3YEY5_9BACT|nr:outer membrane protein assembly factor BamA [Desulfuromusa kysingii]SEA10107.1 Beta-barrel assembly machine subunit BamA [Desulfuromusa kysingii]